MKTPNEDNSARLVMPETETTLLGMGCFWGAERLFWQEHGVIETESGYAGGALDKPTYEDVCAGRSGHAEVVRVVFSPARVSYRRLLALFWEGHDPTQGMRQGNDIGSQYRSVIFTFSDLQHAEALHSRDKYRAAIQATGVNSQITTEILNADAFYPAEAYHQRYLETHPSGYCGLGGLGVKHPDSPANSTQRRGAE